MLLKKRRVSSSSASRGPTAAAVAGPIASFHRADHGLVTDEFQAVLVYAGETNGKSSDLVLADSSGIMQVVLLGSLRTGCFAAWCR